MSRTRAGQQTIDRLAASTASVAHARDLRSAGITRDVVAARIAGGSMAVMLPRTYAVGPCCGEPTFEMWCMAGVLAAGAGALVDGEAAATLRGAWDRGDGVAHVSIPGRCIHLDVPEVRWRRVAPGHGEPSTMAGPIPVACFEDMCLTLGCTLTKWQLANVICRGIYARQTSLSALEDHVEQRGSRKGIRTLRAALRLVRGGSVGTRTRSEDILLGALLDAGAPEPIVNTRGSMGLNRDEPDFYWSRAQLNVEVDGDQHLEPSQAADDARRDEEAAARGIAVIRVPWRHLHAPSQRRRVVRTVLDALRALSRRFSTRRCG